MEEERTRENCFRVVSLANLEPDSLLPKCQAVRFAPEESKNQPLTLLEVTPEVADQLEKGEEFVFRGEPNDWVSLCSKENVYDIKDAETSNSLLLVKDLCQSDGCKDYDEDLAHNVTVVNTFYTFLEIKPTRPGWQKLFRLLEEKIMINFKEDKNTAFWLESELLDRVQCSEKQLIEGLKSVDAIEMDSGKWTLIDSDFRMRIVSLICNLISENSWSWSKVPKIDTVQILSEIEPQIIISQVFDHFFDSEGKVLREKLCRFYGEYLLQSSSAFDFNEFFSIWQESLPIIDNDSEEPFKVDIKQLEGLALVDKGQIRWFPESKLPPVIQERLVVLFDTKEKWTLDEITPFVTNLTTA